MANRTLSTIERVFQTDYRLESSGTITFLASLITASALTILTIAEYFIDLSGLTLEILMPVTLLGVVIAYYANHHREQKFIGTALIILILVMVQSHIILDSRKYYGLIFWIPFMPLLSLITNGIARSRVWLVSSVLAVLINAIVFTIDHGPIQNVDVNVWGFTVVCLIFLSLAYSGFYLLYFLLGNSYSDVVIQRNEIDSLNRDLAQLNGQLEKEVQKRTIDLNDKNQQLQKIAFMNSHKVRSSLSKILAAGQAFNDHPSKQTEMVKIMINACQELDNDIRELGEEIG